MGLSDMRVLELIVNHIKRHDFKDRIGICNAVSDYIHWQGFSSSECLNVVYYLQEAFKSWEFYSGRLTYPIGYNFDDAKRQYYINLKSTDMWDHEKEYGMLRILLLNHVISYFEQLIEEGK